MRLLPKNCVSYGAEISTCRRPALFLSLTRSLQERLSADDLGVFHKVVLPRSCATYFEATADPVPDVLEVP
jgi:hypothetical protein